MGLHEGIQVRTYELQPYVEEIIDDMCMDGHDFFNNKVTGSLTHSLFSDEFFNRWNVRRKWKQSVNFDSMASDAELDEAYLDELEQQVRKGCLNLNQAKM